MVAALLRLLLIASLILNGSGAAMARPDATDTDAVRSASVQHAAHRATDARPPCHMRMDPSNVAMDATMRTDESDAADRHPHGDAGSTCCGSPACQCACLQQAVTIVLDVNTTLLRAADPHGRSMPAHPEPLLPDSLRPPIG